MDAAIVSHSKSHSSQDNVSNQVIIDVLWPYMHGRVHCEPPKVTLSHYSNSQHTLDLRWRVETTKKHVRKAEEQARIANH